MKTKHRKPKQQADRESLLMAELLNRLGDKGIKPLLPDRIFQWINRTDGSYNVITEFRQEFINTVKAYAFEHGYTVSDLKESLFDSNYQQVNFSSKPLI